MKKLSWVFLSIAVLLSFFYLSGHSFSKIPFLAGPAPTPTVTAVPIPQYEIDDIQGTALAVLGGQTQAVTAQEGQVFRQGDEVITEKNSRAVLTLNEVTAVKLSESTTILIAELKPNDTHGFVSRLELIRGKVLSEVEKLLESRSSFEVEAGGVVCGVRGTAFEVDYHNDQTIETNTFHGLVQVSKEQKTEQVAQDQHSVFSVPKDQFLKERSLTSKEQKTYSDWQPVYAMAIQKRENRLAAQQTVTPTVLVPPSPSTTISSTALVPTASPKTLEAAKPEEPTATFTAEATKLAEVPAETDTPDANTPQGHFVGVILLHGKNQSSAEFDDLARKLTAEGFQVSVPNMGWAFGHIYDESYDDSLRDIDNLVTGLKAKGAYQVILGGIGLGAHMAMVYGESHHSISGLVLFEPGHYPEKMYNDPSIAKDVADARRMVNVGNGDQVAEFEDKENNEYIKVKSKASDYLSFMDPEGSATMDKALTNYVRLLPALLVTSVRLVDVENDNVYKFIHNEKKSSYLKTRFTRDVLITNTTNEVGDWIRSLDEH